MSGLLRREDVNINRRLRRDVGKREGDTWLRDPTFGSVAIPKFFWKLMVVKQHQQLMATAFVLSQTGSGPVDRSYS